CCQFSVSYFLTMPRRDMDPSVYNQYKHALPGRFQRRAEHYYSENERVKRGVEAWAAGDLAGFGQLMFESGRSSIVNYECGCPELITIYHLLRECPGVYGVLATASYPRVDGVRCPESDS